MTAQARLLGGRYQVGELLGYGGMAEVHRGRDLRLGRDVAIKMLRADLARDATFQERFRREAQNAAALNHPAIVAVYDTGEELSSTGEKLPFIVDTGSPITLLDPCMTPRLGKRLDKLMISTLDGDDQKSARYVAPKLFLGNTPLVTGSNVATFRLSGRQSPPAMGILGMDCLRHYCLQLDFEAEKLRFLNPDHVDPAGLGQRSKLPMAGGGAFLVTG